MRKSSAAMMTPRTIHPPIGVPPGFDAHTRIPWKPQRTARCVLRRRNGLLDPRIEKLARVLVDYSLQIRRSAFLRLGGTLLKRALVCAEFREAISAGSNPYRQVCLAGLVRYF